METRTTASAEPQDTPWIAEPGEDGFYRVVNSKSVVLAQKCVKEEAELFALAPQLLEACWRSYGVLCDLSYHQCFKEKAKEFREADEVSDMIATVVNKAYGESC